MHETRAPRFSDATLQALRRSEQIVALTGSGISAESGIPTFRGEDGLWKGYRAEELATAEGFRRDPGRVWEWYRWRMRMFRQANPNPGHQALARLEARAALTVVTQNIDGLHQRAGSRRVLELHGSVWRVKCLRPACRRGDAEAPDDPQGVPSCACGAPLRPDVVWFGEALPGDVLDGAAAAVSSCDVALVIGTSALVYPAAMLPVIALDAGAYVIELNPEPTPLTPRVHDSLRGRAGDLLPKLVDEALS